MNEVMKKVLRWGVIGSVVGFVTVWLVSGGMPLGHRVTCGLMAAGGGLVTFALLAANFAKDEESESHGSAPH